MIKKVAVLMGGFSSERDISFLSGKSVCEALRQKGYEVCALEVTPDIAFLTQTLQREKPDVVFNALHGKFGEDGCMQGLLNMMRLPYTHSGVLASALGMDKNACREVAKSLGIDVAKGFMASKKEIQNGKKFSFPYVLKANDEGSSCGVFILKNEEEEKKALSSLADDDKKFLIEEYIPGRELSVMVMDDAPKGVVEIVPESGFYDFDHKYKPNASHHLVPAPILQKDYECAMKQAFEMHSRLGCRGISRSDFRYDDTNPKMPRLVFLEINTNPGMTSVSLVPEIARFCGISYEDLVSYLVEEAKCEN